MNPKLNHSAVGGFVIRSWDGRFIQMESTNRSRNRFGDKKDKPKKKITYFNLVN